MNLEEFTILIAFLAMIYAAISKFIQNKLVDRSEVEAMQAESKKLNEELKAAQKIGNKQKIDQAMQRQMEFLPKMNKVMMAQFKPMIVILVFFFAFTWGISQVNPLGDDDIKITLEDNGLNCDEKEGDGIYSSCYKIDSTNYGIWGVTAKAYIGEDEVGVNHTYFNYNSDIERGFVDPANGNPIEINLDQEEYYPGDEILLSAHSEGADRIEASLDNGTSFSVELPIQIPIVNVKTIYQPYWWFILISLIFNLSIAFVLGRLRGKKK